MVPRNSPFILQNLSFRNRPVGKTSVKTTSELSSYVAMNTSSPRQPVTHTHVCHGVHHILLTQSRSQASLNYLPRCPPSLYLPCPVSEYRDEVKLTKLHFQSFKSYYHINVVENMSLATSCCITPYKKQKCVSHFNHVRLFETTWTVANHPPLSMEFSRQKYWSG